MIGRRGFLVGAGVGVLAVSVPLPALAAGEWEPNVLLRLDSAGGITLTLPRPETGQGVRTVAAMLAAEELAVDVADLRFVQAPGDTQRYGPQSIGGSRSVQQMTVPVRTAAATARCLLVAAAARRWGVPVETCHARDGAVHHRRHGRLRYADLVDDAAAIDPATIEVTLIPRPRWRVLGGRGGRIDARDIVTGRARYGIDVRVPDRRVAAVLRPPWIGARLDTVDDSAVTGVEAVVRLDPATGVQGGVAVIATSTAAALRGRAALRATWTGGTPNADSRAWLDQLAAAVPAPEPFAHTATYRLPLLAHAPMEPMNATAHVRPDGATLWMPTQDPGGHRDRVAAFLGVDRAAVRVEPTLSGGAFGRRFETDFVMEAVVCSRAVGKPVQVVWTRDDDTRHDSYRPMSVHRLSAEVDGSGLPVRRAHDVATWPLSIFPAMPPDLVRLIGDQFPYTVPGDVRIALLPAPLRTGFWRAVYAGQFVYAEECFLGELARRARADQVDFRLRLLGESRLRPVLAAAGERLRPRRGRVRAAACALDYGSACAIVVEADRTGTPTRVVAAVDVGTTLHPSGLRAQVEGCVLDAVSTVFGAQVTVRDGAVVESSFRDYAWARIDQAPDIEVLAVDSGAPIGGLGELAYPPAAAALATAWSMARGEPVTGMPVNRPVG
ncbi:molybdopterin cofactor-binding domain-containing protein [Actinokineospora fastidiosa]|uniref:molybdopterin cofactor-binding domain-containing protein n=1 Tax=Actinokineospora fastidiosa TaxID=1816 RepID=UPI001670C6F0|nr:molybdopterin cofactor-binding domain-containing protein [Actinokineospora fastidiosa]